jgi:hypothetical protein
MTSSSVESPSPDREARTALEGVNPPMDDDERRRWTLQALIELESDDAAPI